MGSRVDPGDSTEGAAMNIELSPQERLTKITDILAEGVLALVLGRSGTGSYDTLLQRLMIAWSKTAPISTTATGQQLPQEG